MHNYEVMKSQMRDPKTDTNFIMRDVYNGSGKHIETSVVGFYQGKQQKEVPEEYIGRTLITHVGEDEL